MTKDVCNFYLVMYIVKQGGTKKMVNVPNFVKLNIL